MIILAWVILGAIVIVAISVPFLMSEKAKRRQEAGVEPVSGPGIVHELDADYRSGVLSKDEYDELKAEYSSPGGVERTLPTRERLSRDEDIERRVRELRQRKAGGGQPVKPDAPAQTQNPGQQGPKGLKKQPVCPKCGQPYKQGDRFCTGCGARLSRGGG